MKIIVSLSEVKALYAADLGLGENEFILEIAGQQAIPTQWAQSAVNLLSDMVQFETANGTLIRGDSKIAAIKLFREHFLNPDYVYNACSPDGSRYLCGLAHAKSTIENWSNFKAKLNETKQLPVVGSAGGVAGWIW